MEFFGTGCCRHKYYDKWGRMHDQGSKTELECKEACLGDEHCVAADSSSVVCYTYTSKWEQTEPNFRNESCGAGGATTCWKKSAPAATCSPEESELRIGGGSPPYTSITYDDEIKGVVGCKATCDASAECAGFVYDRK